MSVGYKLYRQIRDFAPQDWTSGELVIAIMIADSANEETRRSYIDNADLCRRARMTDRGVRKALERLLERGFDFRVSRGKGKDGKEMYALSGKRTEYQVPDIFARLERGSVIAYGLVDKLTADGTAVPPDGRLSTATCRYCGTAEPEPQYRLPQRRALILILNHLNHLNHKGNCPHT
jgi:hypothetical protein